MEINFKKLTECRIEDIIKAWNRGFEGYYIKIEMTPDTFFHRMVNEGLSMNLSFVAFHGEEPVAILVNGIRTLNGKKMAWNGGTGVAPEYRGKGVSRLLMEEVLKIYEKEGIEVASLEAIKENERAIRLYKRFGYEIVDSLVLLNGTREFATKLDTSIQVKAIRPEQLSQKPFYHENVPWQCQWQSVKAGESQIYYDSENNILCYCLYRRIWSKEGKVEKVIIYQLELFCEIHREIMDMILFSISGEVGNQVEFMTINSSLSNPAIQYLQANGFQKTTEQVQMVKRMN
ncbi:GNAT family N-acetyltransferase [Bacillus thermocopriae]|uniref:GNAT family N-acetyltransferase n=1 Tax=Neobacillus thermocopriae TaxID=1215031 RepID=A0A6B3TMB8_9BACI|nr:GNAT family N-acetyltransferase [Neobacillus thermocopriae]NEX78084.1 GNAT family N-acetyltransferase [Neobacillus thermocopriae]